MWYYVVFSVHSLVNPLGCMVPSIKVMLLSSHLCTSVLRQYGSPGELCAKHPDAKYIYVGQDHEELIEQLLSSHQIYVDVL